MLVFLCKLAFCYWCNLVLCTVAEQVARYLGDIFMREIASCHVVLFLCANLFLAI